MYQQIYGTPKCLIPVIYADDHHTFSLNTKENGKCVS